MELREKIRNITKRHILRRHISRGGVIAGQALSAVGWCAGTIPDDIPDNEGIIELPVSDLNNGGVVTGFGIVGVRPFFVIRYQGFSWYNMLPILNYACKSKELWGQPCPIFIRAIAMEGSIGPVAGSSHHSLCYRMPGIKIYSPMTPGEYEKTYSDFIFDDEVYYVSEHRGSYNNSEELPDIWFEKPDFVLFPISITRFAAIEASKLLLAEGHKVSVHHQFILKPFEIQDEWRDSLVNADGVVLDDDYPDGIASTLAHKLMLATSSKVYTMGLSDRTAGFSPQSDNLPPSTNAIYDFVKGKLCSR